MKRSTGMAGAAWAATTVLVTGVSWAGVQAVDRAVEGQSVPAIPADQLTAGPGGGRPVSGSTGRAVAATSTTTVAGHPGSVPAARVGSSSGRSSSDGASSGGASSGGSASGRSTPDSASPATSTTAAPSSDTAVEPAGAVYSTPGGEIAVTCSGAAITLDSATPADGYQMTVGASGPARVEVAFAGGSGRYTIVSACRDGRPALVGSSSDVTSQPVGPPPPPAGSAGGGAGTGADAGGGGSGAGAGGGGTGGGGRSSPTVPPAG